MLSKLITFSSAAARVHFYERSTESGLFEALGNAAFLAADNCPSIPNRTIYVNSNKALTKEEKLLIEARASDTPIEWDVYVCHIIWQKGVFIGDDRDFSMKVKGRKRPISLKTTWYDTKKLHRNTHGVTRVVSYTIPKVVGDAMEFMYHFNALQTLFRGERAASAFIDAIIKLDSPPTRNSGRYSDLVFHSYDKTPINISLYLRSIRDLMNLLEKRVGERAGAAA